MMPVKFKLLMLSVVCVGLIGGASSVFASHTWVNQCTRWASAFGGWTKKPTCKARGRQVMGEGHDDGDRRITVWCGGAGFSNCQNTTEELWQAEAVGNGRYGTCVATTFDGTSARSPDNACNYDSDFRVTLWSRALND